MIFIHNPEHRGWTLFTCTVIDVQIRCKSRYFNYKKTHREFIYAWACRESEHLSQCMWTGFSPCAESTTNQAKTCEILQQMITDNNWKRWWACKKKKLLELKMKTWTSPWEDRRQTNKHTLLILGSICISADKFPKMQLKQSFLIGCWRQPCWIFHMRGNICPFSQQSMHISLPPVFPGWTW